MSVYRLGDAIWTLVSPKIWNSDFNYIQDRYPTTLGGQVRQQLQNMPRPCDPWIQPISCLAELVRTRAPSVDNVAVCHLRTGDVMRYRPWSGQRAFFENDSPCYPTLVHFRQFADHCKKHSVRRVHLMATLHLHHLHNTKQKTLDYVKTCETWLTEQGFVVSSTIGDSDTPDAADADFIRLCTARHVLLSGGGFAALIWIVRNVLGKGNNTIAPFASSSPYSPWWKCAAEILDAAKST